MRFLIGLVVGAVIAAAIGAAAFNRIDGVEFGDHHDDDDSSHVSRTLDLTGFEKISVAGVYDLDVEVGKDFSIELSGPEKEMERAEAVVEDGVLVLGQRKDKKVRLGLNRKGIDAVITMPALVGFDVSGVVDADIDGVDADAFSVDLSGVGDVDLAGACNSLKARVSGVGDLEAEDLICKTVDVRVSGVGDASVHASEAVDAHISGMGGIDIYGAPPEVRKSGTMLSSIDVH